MTASHRNLELAAELVAACFDPVRPEEFARFCDDERGRFIFGAFAVSFPDARFQVDWVVADENRVVIGGRTHATHDGRWRGIEASGRSIDVATVASLAVSDGRVVDVSIVSDSLSIAEQLGAVEPFAPRACQVFAQSD